MSTYVEVEISPDTTTRPVFTSVSQATRPPGSSAITASRTPSEIWSATLSGWPSVTDSDVNRYSLSESGCVVMRRGRLATDRPIAAHNGRIAGEGKALLVAHAPHRVLEPDGFERGARLGAEPALAQLELDRLGERATV